MRRRYEWILICILLLLIITSMKPIQTCYAVGSYPCDCICGISFNQDSEPPSVDVSPGLDGKGTLTFIAYCNPYLNDNFSDSHFIIMVSSERGWVLDVEPQEFNLTSKHDQQLIYVNISVPLNTSFYVLDIITISANVTYIFENFIYTSTIDPIPTTIRVKQYFGIEIIAESITKNIEKGTNRILNFTIRNTGNAQDVYRLELNNRFELEKAGIEISYPTEIEIESRENRTVEVFVNTTKDSKNGKFDIKFSVKSLQEERNSGPIMPYNFTLNCKIIQKSKHIDIVPILVRICMISLLFLMCLLTIKWLRKLKKKIFLYFQRG